MLSTIWRRTNLFRANEMSYGLNAFRCRDISGSSSHCPWADTGALDLAVQESGTPCDYNVFRIRGNRQPSGFFHAMEGPGTMMIKSCGAFLLAASLLAAADEPKTYRVDDHVYRGRQPRREDFPELAKMGIRTVLDLRGGPIHKPRERKEVESAGMQYISIRLSGIFAPKYEQIGQILAVLQDANR